MSITIVANLQIELQGLLPNSDECWVAVALMNESGFQFIEQNLPSTALRHYVVGVDLPTSPDVLRELMKREKTGIFTTRIFKTKQYFHPKLYILRTDTAYTAFVGSGNCTTGGLSGNVELSIKITDSAQCLELIQNCFDTYFKEGTPINEKFLEGYQPIFTRRKARAEEDEQDLQQIVVNSNQKQFFKPEHHMAFEPRRWEDKSKEAVRLRQAVVNRFLELHNQIYPIQFRQHGLLNLHAHYHSNYITSLPEHREGFNAKQLKSVWLHYGKPEHEIREYQNLLRGLGKNFSSKGDIYDQQSFINHIRMQVIIHQKDVGIWLVIGKDDGSLYDREFISRQMNNEDYKATLFKAFSALKGYDYWVRVGGLPKEPIDNILGSDQLRSIIRKAKTSEYFVIEKTFLPDNPALSEDSIATTVLTEFSRLYPLYELMQDRRFDSSS